MNKSLLAGQGGRGLRERQSVWCCGSNYQRWRFVGREFPGTHHTTCIHCGKVLDWPEGREYLTTAFRQEARQKTFRSAYLRRADRHELAGKTRHGQVPKYRPRRSAQELAWRELRAEMGEIKAPEILTANYWARHEQ